MLRGGRWTVAAAAAIAIGFTGCAPGPDDETGSAGTAGGERIFVETLGVDTIAVESFARTDSTITGTVVSRNPTTTVAHYQAALDAGGGITSLEASWVPGEALDGDPSSRVTLQRNGAAVQVIRERSAGTDTVDLEAEAFVVPNLGRLPLSVGLVELATRRAVGTESGLLNLALLSPLQGRVGNNAIEARDDGTYSLDYFGNPMILTVDETGAVRAISGRETTNRVEIVPIGAGDAVDLDALAADFAARDAAGEGLGVPSPTDTAVAVIDGAELEVVYSRPAMRGREIWGALVPFGEVWRTGANAATHFSTSRPIRFGELDLPAGTYTLWSTYTADSATLIVNSQTGQWGTAYDASQDYGRTAMERRPASPPAERFTIEFADGAGSGTSEMHLVWADRRYVVPIVVG